MFQEPFLRLYMYYLILQQSCEEGTIFFSIYKVQMKGTERLSTLPKVTQEGSGKTGI